VSTAAGSNAEVRTTLAGSNKAIRYLGWSYTEDGAVGVINPLDGVKPTARAIKRKETTNSVAGCTSTHLAMTCQERRLS